MSPTSIPHLCAFLGNVDGDAQLKGAVTLDDGVVSVVIGSDRKITGNTPEERWAQRWMVIREEYQKLQTEVVALQASRDRARSDSKGELNGTTSTPSKQNSFNFGTGTLEEFVKSGELPDVPPFEFFHPEAAPDSVNDVDLVEVTGLSDEEKKAAAERARALRENVAALEAVLQPLDELFGDAKQLISQSFAEVASGSPQGGDEEHGDDSGSTGESTDLAAVSSNLDALTSRLHARLQQQAEAAETLREQLKKAENETQVAQQALNETQSALYEAKSQLSEAQTRSERAEAAAAAEARATRAAEQRVDEALSRAAATATEKEAALAQAREHAATAADLQTQMENLTKAMETLELHESQAKNDNETMSVKVSELAKAVAEADELRMELECQIAAARSQSEEELAAAQNAHVTTTTLREELQERDERVAKLAAELSDEQDLRLKVTTELRQQYEASLAEAQAMRDAHQEVLDVAGRNAKLVLGALTATLNQQADALSAAIAADATEKSTGQAMWDAVKVGPEFATAVGVAQQSIDDADADAVTSENATSLLCENASTILDSHNGILSALLKHVDNIQEVRLEEVEANQAYRDALLAEKEAAQAAEAAARAQAAAAVAEAEAAEAARLRDNNVGTGSGSATNVEARRKFQSIVKQAQAQAKEATAASTGAETERRRAAEITATATALWLQRTAAAAKKMSPRRRRPSQKSDDGDPAHASAPTPQGGIDGSDSDFDDVPSRNTQEGEKVSGDDATDASPSDEDRLRQAFAAFSLDSPSSQSEHHPEPSTARTDATDNATVNDDNVRVRRQPRFAGRGSGRGSRNNDAASELPRSYYEFVFDSPHSTRRTGATPASSANSVSESAATVHTHAHGHSRGHDTQPYCEHFDRDAGPTRAAIDEIRARSSQAYRPQSGPSPAALPAAPTPPRTRDLASTLMIRSYRSPAREAPIPARSLFKQRENIVPYTQRALRGYYNPRKATVPTRASSRAKSFPFTHAR